NSVGLTPLWGVHNCGQLISNSLQKQFSRVNPLWEVPVVGVALLSSPYCRSVWRR
ncbi:9119_t:CDS:1, partial [Acaulospora morrowiae]